MGDEKIGKTEAAEREVWLREHERRPCPRCGLPVWVKRDPKHGELCYFCINAASINRWGC